MAFTDRVVEYPGRVTLTNVSDDVYDLTREEGEIYTEGTLLNAANLNQQTQLDSAVEGLFTTAGMTPGTYQNEVSDALGFIAEKPMLLEEYDSEDGVWHVRRWSNGIVEQWGNYTRTGTFTTWGSLSYADVAATEPLPVSGGTVLSKLMAGYVEGVTTWVGELTALSTVRFMSSGTPSGSKTCHAYIYLMQKMS